MAGKLILLGIDGATWDVIRPLIDAGELPNFKKLILDASLGNLISTVPPLTPPAWTSMFTGVNPGKHGIIEFVFREGHRFVTCSSRYRMCPTIWSILSEAGRKCIVINDPVTYPAERINGIMTTGLMTPAGPTDWIYPRELKKEINTVAGGYEFDIPFEFKSVLVSDREKALDILRNLTTKVLRVSSHAMRNYEWDVFAVIVTTTDRLQHYFWGDTAEMAKHYAMLDDALGEFLDLSTKLSADLLVVSDHGFGPANKFFQLNEWLGKAGLSVYKESTVYKVFSRLGIRGDKIDFKVWGRSQLFLGLPGFLQDAIRRNLPAYASPWPDVSSRVFATPTSLFVRDSKDREVVANELGKVADPITGIPVFETIVSKEDVLHGPYLYRAPELFVLPTRGYSVSTSSEDVIGVRGTHRPEGIFMYYRPGVSSREEKPRQVRPWEVAGLVLNTINVPIPEYFDGNLVLP